VLFFAPSMAYDLLIAASSGFRRLILRLVPGDGSGEQRAEASALVRRSRSRRKHSPAGAEEQHGGNRGRCRSTHAVSPDGAKLQRSRRLERPARPPSSAPSARSALRVSGPAQRNLGVKGAGKGRQFPAPTRSSQQVAGTPSRSAASVCIRRGTARPARIPKASNQLFNVVSIVCRCKGPSRKAWRSTVQPKRKPGRTWLISRARQVTPAATSCDEFPPHAPIFPRAEADAAYQQDSHTRPLPSTNAW